MTQTATIVTPPTADSLRLKRGGLVWLAIILLGAFFMPMIQLDYSTVRTRNNPEPGYKVTFVNLEMLTTEANIPASARFGAAFPGIVGIVILIAAVATPKLVCSIIVTLIGLFAFLSMMVGANMQQTSQILPGVTQKITVIYVLLLAGLTGLLAGSLAKRHRPGSSFASLLGIIGAAALLAGLFLPLLPAGSEKFLAMAPRALIKSKDGMATAIGVVMAIGILLFAIAAIIALCNVPGRRAGAAKSMGSSSYTCMVFGTIALLLTFLIPFFSAIGNEAQIIPATCTMLKMILWIGGMFLILPLGLGALAISLNNDPTLVGGIVPPAIPTAAAAPAPNSSQARLQELQTLFEKGIITSREYEEQRAKIVSSL